MFRAEYGTDQEETAPHGHLSLGRALLDIFQAPESEFKEAIYEDGVGNVAGLFLAKYQFVKKWVLIVGNICLRMTPATISHSLHE